MLHLHGTIKNLQVAAAAVTADEIVIRHTQK